MTSLHNQVFLEGVKSALLGPKGLAGGGVMVNGESNRDSWSKEEKEVGLKALARVYAGWYVLHLLTSHLESNWLNLEERRGFSQAFYREKLHEKHFGFKDLESFMVGFWEEWACSKGGSVS